MVLMDLPTLESIRPIVAPGSARRHHPAPRVLQSADGERRRRGYREVRGYLDEEEWWIESFGNHRHYHRPLGYYAEWIASLGLGIVGTVRAGAVSLYGLARSHTDQARDRRPSGHDLEIERRLRHTPRRFTCPTWPGPRQGVSGVQGRRDVLR